MSAISFSLTQKLIIDPITNLRAPLDPSDAHCCSAHLSKFIQSQVIARVIAVFASVIALADTLIHLFLAVCKCDGGHLKRAALHGLITIGGSIAGVICPGIFECLRATPPLIHRAPQQDPQNGSDLDLDKVIIPKIYTVIEGKRNALFLSRQGAEQNRSAFLNGAYLGEKAEFVLVFSSHPTSPELAETYHAAREQMVEMVYTPINRKLADRVQWLSMTELYQKTYGQMEEFLTEGYYTHMTSEDSLTAILLSKKVLVMHRQAFKGAFVATSPQYSFGSCGLVFKRNIERHSILNHGFHVGDDFWAGFSEPVPVTQFSLAYVILEKGNIDDCKALSERCAQVFDGNPVVVTTREVVDKAFSHLSRLNMGIPREWEEADDSVQSRVLAVFAQIHAQAQEAVVARAPSAYSIAAPMHPPMQVAYASLAAPSMHRVRQLATPSTSFQHTHAQQSASSQRQRQQMLALAH